MDRSCTKCKVSKRSEDFYFHKGQLRSWCKVCEDIRTNDYYHKKMRDPVFRERKRIESAAARTKPKNLFRIYKHNASIRNLAWDLSFEQFMTFWQKPCFYCGIAVETAGLDRVDNSKGYLLDNIVPCCKVCNYMKVDFSQAQFLEKCRQIVAFKG